MISTVLGKKIILHPTTCSIVSSNFFLYSHPIPYHGYFVQSRFFQGIPSELQETLQLGGRVSTDISTLVTSLLQEQSLQTLREQVVVAFNRLSDENHRIRQIIFTVTNDFGSPYNYLLVTFHHSGSVAKQIIVTHFVPDVMVIERPLVVKRDENNSSTKPTDGCMGSTTHRFVTFP